MLWQSSPRDPHARLRLQKPEKGRHLRLPRRARRFRATAGAGAHASWARWRSCSTSTSDPTAGSRVKIRRWCARTWPRAASTCSSRRRSKIRCNPTGAPMPERIAHDGDGSLAAVAGVALALLAGAGGRIALLAGWLAQPAFALAFVAGASAASASAPAARRHRTGAAVGGGPAGRRRCCWRGRCWPARRPRRLSRVLHRQCAQSPSC